MTALLLIPGPTGDYVIGAVVILVALLIVAFCRSASQVDEPEQWRTLAQREAARRARMDVAVREYGWEPEDFDGVDVMAPAYDYLGGAR